MTTVIFIHRGDSRYLRFAVAQARSCGYRTIVVGDEAVRSGVDFAATGAEYIDISRHTASAEQFARIYQHISLNEEGYELFCFQRWYILKEVLKIAEYPIVYLDSDVLVYPGLSQEIIAEATSGLPFCNTPWFNHIGNSQALDAFLAHVNNLYSNKISLLNSVRDPMRYGKPHISDMAILRLFPSVAPEVCVDLFDRGLRFGFDNNIRRVDRTLSHLGHKALKFEGDIPYTWLNDGTKLRLYSLHFQGRSKPLMQVMSRIDPAYLNANTDLSDTVLALEREHGASFADVATLFRTFAEPETAGSSAAT